MTEPKRLLMLDDDAAIGQLVCRVVRRAGFEARCCTNVMDAGPARAWLSEHAS